MQGEAAAPPPTRVAPPNRRRSRALQIAAVIAVCVAAFVVIHGVMSRAGAARQVKDWTSAKAVPAVTLIRPTRAGDTASLDLPGNLQAFYKAQIYSRVSGYVHAWYKDIGAHVAAGELLATIDTPELDQQLLQARADLESARASMSLAGTTAQRWTTLLKLDAVSKQESDEKSGDLLVKTAAVNAAEANLDRLLALKGFARITAPFEGVVTARKTDIGALVNAGAGATPNSELFDVAKIDRLRLYVRVPQSDSARIRPGATATITVPEHPRRSFTATLTSTSGAVNDASGTLLVELAVDNADHALQAGDYAQVKFTLPDEKREGGSTLLRLPPSALLFRNTGMEAALIGPDERVHLRPVTVARDLGSALEIARGLSPGDAVIDNPPDSIAEGERVRVVQPDAAAASGPAHAAR